MSRVNKARRWRPSPFIAASIALHVGAVLLVVLAPHLWPWALDAVLVNQLIITVAGLLPRSRLLGDNLVKLPAAAIRRNEVALTFDDGPDPEVTPQVLALLAQHHVRATFFCIGERAAAYPEICKNIIAQGHHIENHGQRHHPATAFSGVRGWLKEIRKGQTTLTQLTGKPPRYYRALAGIRNPFLDPALQLAGIRLASWTRRGYDTRCADADQVLARLTHNLAAGDILLMHDGNSRRDADGTPVVIQVLPRLLQQLSERNLKPVVLDSE